MGEEFKKVIKLFGDKKNPACIQKNEHGVYFVRAEKDENGNFFNADHLINFANDTDYLIRVMKVEDSRTCVYTYKISGDMLVSFISNYSDEDETERIIEIIKCQPQNLA